MKAMHKARILRNASEMHVHFFEDACQKAMALADHHEWGRLAANQLKCEGDTLWQAMCAEWAASFSGNEAEKAIRPIEESI
jgi:predicted amidophosphoribosyltransferase